ncbi:aminopeptidase P family protein [Clostridium sp. AM58-1XD]|uniref:aminopeptidase P family protein n=1 Tax=Clostridium sp. AM58-1XD TaxID=2292307 RepID=UPI000E52A350|nr:aminopeptidase P family protein [Clostridium sp. AM58-1XD]RGY98358.1 aminopeptidase P family protein [Clostridium sp. AM58-1XD]
MEIRDRLERLRNVMRDKKIDAYMIPTADCHESEYVGSYFKCREYMTGFTGSAGTVVVTQKESCLWTDGRYFVQAETEMDGSGILLMKMGEEGVPSIEAYVKSELPDGGVLGFDGRVINAEMGEALERCAAEKGGTICCDLDLVGEIWNDRPALSSEPVWILDEAYAGKSAANKLDELKKAMKNAGASVHIMTTLDDIVWLLNIRGNDIPTNPVALCYFVMTEEKNMIFIQGKALDQNVRSYFEKNHLEVHPYEEIYEFVKGLKNEKILLEKGKMNTALWRSVDSSNVVIDKMNPCSRMKAVKNETEMENIRRAHIKDGAAVTKFIYWLKKNIGKVRMDEMGVSDQLEALRKEQPGYLGPSFHTISAYGPNAAMCHYSVNGENNTKLEPRGLYLVDSGGQYYEGTTDITRTIALGELTDEEKLHFTLVAMGMLRLGNARFLYGCSGANLDYIAREPLWQQNLNFNHGTGHGVGYLLNVHERPNSIRWKSSAADQDWVMEEGMLTSDEPGIYMEGSHGIRTENLMLCHRGEKNEYGQFMEFEFVTFAPIDLDAIDVSVMEERDIELLNRYHKAVREKISPYLDKEERTWLEEYTREIRK